MTIRKLFLRQTLISVVALLVGVFALFKSARLPTRLLERSEETGNLIRLLGSQVVFSNEYAAHRGDRPLRQWDIADRQIQETLTAIEATAETPEERDILSTLRWHYARASRVFERLRFAIGPDAADTPAMETRASVMVDELSQRLQTMTGDAYRLNAAVAARLARDNRRSAWIVGGAFGVVFLVLFIDLFLIAHFIVRPLSRLHSGTLALATGDFNHVVPVGRKDEIGELAEAFNDMAAELRRMYGRIENELEDRRRAEQALRETDERLRMTLDSAQMGTWTWEIKPDRVQFDERLTSLLGLKGPFAGSIEQALGTVHVEDRDRMRGEILSAITQGREVDISARIQHPDGVVRTLGVRGNVLKDASGKAIVLSGVAWDITEKKLVEERLLGSQRALQRAHDQLETMVDERTRALVRKTFELERSNADLEQFAYVASHDLQEPLRKISSYGELLQERYGDALDDRGRRYAAYMVDGVRRLQELIHALLAYSRLNRSGEAFGPVSLEDVLSQVLTDMDVAVREAGAVIRCKSLPTIWGSGVEIGQLFQNLLSNAIKFRGTAPLQIEISAENRSADWLIKVRDNGIGIEPEYRDRIFVVFQRLHSRSEVPGTGIGLAICKKIVERHGGRIWVESQPGMGSTFCLTLMPPPKPASPSHDAPSPSTAGASTV